MLVFFPSFAEESVACVCWMSVLHAPRALVIDLTGFVTSETDGRLLVVFVTWYEWGLALIRGSSDEPRMNHEDAIDSRNIDGKMVVTLTHFVTVSSVLRSAMYFESLKTLRRSI